MENKILIFIAVALITTGAVIFVVVMSALGWDFTKLGTVKYETNTYSATESFDSISINIDTADIRLLPSESSDCRVVVHENAKIKHEVSVVDGTLTVVTVDSRAWYDYISIGFSSQTVTVYLPEREYSKLFVRTSTGHVEVSSDFTFSALDVEVSTGDVTIASSVTGNAKIKASTGSITVDGATLGSLDITTTTGSITVEDVNVTGSLKTAASTGRTSLSNVGCKSLTSTAGTGNINLSDTVADESFSLETDTGSIRFDSCDAKEISAAASTGSITGTLLTDKTFVADSSTGTVDVPGGTAGGMCELSTDTGNIRISVVAAPYPG